MYSLVKVMVLVKGRMSSHAPLRFGDVFTRPIADVRCLHTQSKPDRCIHSIYYPLYAP